MQPNDTLVPTAVPVVVTPGSMQYEIANENGEKELVTSTPNEANPAGNAPLLTQEQREAQFHRVAALMRQRFVQQILEKRAKENARALRGRVSKRRKKNKLAKASRKRNRG